MDDERAVGWTEDSVGPDQYRYWNGSQWTGHATVSEDGNHGMRGTLGGSLGGRNGTWYRKILRNSVVFHTMAWFDCSAPLTGGHLQRMTSRRVVEKRSSV
jgi:hypothetical protein